jgi:UDP:flavonoid glycosyltransferase YjiC (YdhE family)
MFNVLGADGHFLPMVPLARGLVTAGHDVVFVVTAPYDELVTRRGFRSIGVDAPRDLTGFEFISGIDQRGGVDRLRYTIEAFLDLAVVNAQRVVELADTERPDVLIRETSGWGAWMAGELLDVPVAAFDYSPAPSGFFARFAGDLFQRARAAVGLVSDETLQSLDRYLTIVGAPPRWFSPDCFRPTSHLFQPPADALDGGALPDWFATLPDRPIVYVTMGTVFNETPGIFPMVLAAVADLEANVIITVGRSMDPATLGATPAHVHVERFIPQGLVIDRCAAVIAHGGYGSLMGALRRGVPMVTIPLAAGDNALNAARVSQLGAGIAIPEKERSTERIAAAARAVLREPCYRDAARLVAEEIAKLPPFTDAVPLIERLARDRQPIPCDT